jgi:hypothetical protein
MTLPICFRISVCAELVTEPLLSCIQSFRRMQLMSVSSEGA